MRRTFLFLLFLVACARPAAAETLTIAVEDISYLPYHGFKNGTFTGFAQKVLTAWAQSRGADVVFEPISVKRKVEALVDPAIDLVWPDNPSWRGGEKAALGQPVRYSQVVINGSQGVLVLHGTPPLGLAEVTALGTIVGFSNDMVRLGIDTAGKQMIETRTVNSLVEMLVANRVDGIYCDLYAAEYELRRLNAGFALDFAVGSPKSPSPYRLSSIARPELIENFNAWLAGNAPTVDRLTKEAFPASGAS